METFTLLGHQKQQQLFLQSSLEKNAPSTWLFYGPKGIGKAMVAQQLAQQIFCQNNPQISEKIIERQMQMGVFPNFTLINSEKNTITAEQCRQLKEAMKKTAVNYGWRIVIIDAVDNLTTQGANALLKLLEEPPANSLIILISHNYGKVLPTIRSRACQLPFYPLNDLEMQNLLPENTPSFLVDLAMGQPSFFKKIAEIPSEFWDLFKKVLVKALKKDTNVIRAGVEKILTYGLPPAILYTILSRMLYFLTIGKKNWQLSLPKEKLLDSYHQVNNFYHTTENMALDPYHQTLAMFLSVADVQIPSLRNNFALY